MEHVMKQHNYLSNINFLVVDDNAFMRTTIRRILETLGAFRVREAPDGAEAIKMMESWSVDIVLTDWVMTPLDGIEFTKIVRHSREFAHRFVPIIIVSAYSESWRVAEARDAGVTEYIVKPISATTMFAHIRKAVEEPRPFINAPGYFGPDRRRHDLGCTVERRKTEPAIIPPDSIESLGLTASPLSLFRKRGRPGTTKMPHYDVAGAQAANAPTVPPRA